jgi:hypothetical protein
MLLSLARPLKATDQSVVKPSFQARGVDVARRRRAGPGLRARSASLGHQLAALAHRQAGARLDHAGQDRLEVLRAQAEERLDALPKLRPRYAAAAAAGTRARIDHRRIADGVDAAGDAGVDLAERDLVADRIAASRLVPQARCMSRPGVCGSRPVESTHSRTRLKSFECFSTAPARHRRAAGPAGRSARPRRAARRSSSPGCRRRVGAVGAARTEMREPPMTATYRVLRPHHHGFFRGADRAGHAHVHQQLGTAAVPVRPAPVRLSPARR